jgi:hypothetical protein
LHPLYQALSNGEWIARVLPAPFRPRVVVFHARGRDQFRLLWGRRIIGRLDDQGHQWQIQRPFRVFVMGRAFVAEESLRAKPGAPAVMTGRPLAKQKNKDRADPRA